MPLDPPTLSFLLSLLGAPLPREGPLDWAAIEESLGRHRLEGVALARRGDLLPAELRAAVEARGRRAALATALAVEGGTLARDALAHAGIPALLFKGAALMRAGLYAHPGFRPMDDADVLVPEKAGGRAFGVLLDAGFRPWSPWEEGRGDWLDCAGLLAPTATAALPVSVDLHWRLGYDRLRFGEGESAGRLWEGADLERGLPRPEPHLVIVAEHLVKHLRVRAHLIAFADLVRLAGVVTDWDAVVRTARGRRSSRGVGWALEAARAELGASVPGPVVAALSGSAAVPRALSPSALLRGAHPGAGRARGLALRWRLMGGRGALEDLRQAMLPSGRWLRARYGAGPVPLLWLRYAKHMVGWLVGTRTSPVSPNQELL